MESGSTEMGVNAGTLLTAVAVTAKELAVLGVYSVGARLRGWMFSVLSNRLASAVGRSVGCSAQTPSLRGVLSADVACSPTRTAFQPHTHTERERERERYSVPSPLSTSHYLETRRFSRR